jgi:hypothetical protein
MREKLRMDPIERSVLTSRSEVELPSQLDHLALRTDDPDEIEVPKSIHPEEARTSLVRERTLTASTPGSEYWLP